MCRRSAGTEVGPADTRHERITLSAVGFVVQRMSSSTSGHRAQRQQVLGALALAVPDVPAPDLRRVGRAVHPALLLGPNVNDRRSPTEWSGSRKVMAKGSPNSVEASSNDTRCFRRFSAAFLGSHSKCIAQFYAAGLESAQRAGSGARRHDASKARRRSTARPLQPVVGPPLRGPAATAHTLHGVRSRTTRRCLLRERPPRASRCRCEPSR